MNEDVPSPQSRLNVCYAVATMRQKIGIETLLVLQRHGARRDMRGLASLERWRNQELKWFGTAIEKSV